MSQQDEELKPCPFCGSAPVWRDWSVCLECPDCGLAKTGDYTGRLGEYQREARAAIAAWNRRAPEHEKAAPTAEPVAWRTVYNDGGRVPHSAWHDTDFPGAEEIKGCESHGWRIEYAYSPPPVSAKSDKQSG